MLVLVERVPRKVPERFRRVLKCCCLVDVSDAAWEAPHLESEQHISPMHRLVGPVQQIASPSLTCRDAAVSPLN